MIYVNAQRCLCLDIISLFLYRRSIDLPYNFRYEEIVTIDINDILATVTPAGNHFQITIILFNFKLTLQSLEFTVNMSVVSDDQIIVHNLLQFFFSRFFPPKTTLI